MTDPHLPNVGLVEERLILRRERRVLLLQGPYALGVGAILAGTAVWLGLGEIWLGLCVFAGVGGLVTSAAYLVDVALRARVARLVADERDR